MNISGVRWKCDVCVDYNLCLDCYMDNKHASHAFVRYDSSIAPSVTVPPRQLQSDAEAGTMLHDGITCDECLEDGIFGTRWKCLLCHDYDLCDSCYMDGKHNQEHAFLKLNTPGGVATRVPPRKTTARSQLSYFIPRGESSRGPPCNSCCRKHLPGVRWQCDVCSDYNLCSDCYASNKHRLDHSFLRFDSPRGTGIKVSPRQQSAQTSSAGARHTGVNCDACGEQGILGTRWKCQLCRNYDLCTVCYNGGRHEQEHAFLRILRPGDTAASVPPRKPFTKTQPKLSDEDFVDLRNPSQRKEQAPTRTEVDHAAETEQERELRQIKESLDCGICLERRRNVAFLCGHSACAVCAATLTICHMCRIPIGRKITLY
nr:ZZ-type zinc finger-containing protein P35G2.11c-like [Rhipicephalus microplus]